MKRSDRKFIIKRKAKELTNFPNSFKASKGWFDKFCQRFKISIDYIDSIGDKNF